MPLKERDYTEYTDLLPIQYNDSAKLRKFLEVYLNKVQELNTSQIELSSINTDFNVATGYQLDLIGKLVGADRLGRTDSDYRDYILFKISINIGSGTPEDVIGYLSVATSATTVRYWEHYPACTMLETNGLVLPAAIPSTLDNVTPAGVRTGGILTLDNNYAHRPVELSTAYDNAYFPTSPSNALGEEKSELGIIELRGIGDSVRFTLISKDSLLGQGIYPELSEVYETGYNLAGAENMLSGDTTALSAGLYFRGKDNMGCHAELLTDRNQK